MHHGQTEHNGRPFSNLESWLNYVVKLLKKKCSLVGYLLNFPVGFINIVSSVCTRNNYIAFEKQVERSTCPMREWNMRGLGVLLFWAGFLTQTATSEGVLSLQLKLWGKKA